MTPPTMTISSTTALITPIRMYRLVLSSVLAAMGCTGTAWEETEMRLMSEKTESNSPLAQASYTCALISSACALSALASQAVLYSVLLALVVLAAMMTSTVVEPEQTPTILTRDWSSMRRMAHMRSTRRVGPPVLKKSLMFMAKRRVSWTELVRRTRMRQLRSPVTTKCTVQFLQKKMLLPQTLVSSAACPLLSSSEIGLLTTPLTDTSMELGKGQQSLTTIQSELLPVGILFWSWKRMSSGGFEAKVMLQTFCSCTTEMNLPSRLFSGSPPIHSHSLKPFVSVVQLPPSKLRLTGHMMRVLKSGAMLSYSNAPKSLRLQWWPLMEGTRVQPGVLLPMSELLARRKPPPGRKVPEWSSMMQLFLPVQVMLPQPPNHPSSLSRGASKKAKAPSSQLVQEQSKRWCPPTKSEAPGLVVKTTLLLHCVSPEQLWRQESKTTFVRKALLSKVSCLQSPSKPESKALGQVSPLIVTASMRMALLPEQPILPSPQQTAQLGLETCVMQESEKQAVRSVPSSPQRRERPRWASAMMQLLNCSCAVLGGCETWPTLQAQARTPEQARQASSVVLISRKATSSVVPAVLPGKGVAVIMEQGMKGITYPLRSDPWQTLLLISRLSVEGSTSVSSTQATGSLPVMVGRTIAPIITLLLTEKLAMRSSFKWNLRASQKTLLLTTALLWSEPLMQKLRQQEKEEAFTTEAAVLVSRLLYSTRLACSVSYCPPCVNSTPLKVACPAREIFPSHIWYTTTEYPHPLSGPETILMLRVTWPTEARVSRVPTLLLMVTAGSPKCTQASAGAKETVFPLMPVMVTRSYSRLLKKLGAITISSPTLHPEAASTVIEVSPLLAMAASLAATVVGATPQRASLPVTTKILLPSSEGSITYPGSSLLPLSWMCSLLVKGAAAEPAVSEPALIQMDWQVRLRSAPLGMITSPSISMNSQTAGSTSMMMVQLPLTVTFSPSIGIRPSGHWLALLQYLTKLSFTNSPSGAGQRQRQQTAVTSVVSKQVLFLALAHSSRVRLPAVLSWQYSPLKQEVSSRKSLARMRKGSEPRGCPGRTGVISQSSRLRVQLKRKRMAGSEGCMQLLEVIVRWSKSSPVSHQMLQMCPARQGMAQVFFSDFIASILLLNEKKEQISEKEVESSATSSCGVAISCALSPLRKKRLSGARWLKVTRTTLTELSQMMVLSQLAALVVGRQAGSERRCLQLQVTAAAVRSLPSNWSVVKEPSRSQRISRLRPFMKSLYPLTLVKVMFEMQISCAVLVNRSELSQCEQVSRLRVLAGKLQNRMLSMRMLPCRGVMMPFAPSTDCGAFERVCPMITEFLNTVSSLLKQVIQNSAPARLFSALVKLVKTRLAVSSASRPDSPFLQSVQFAKVLITPGFAAHGSMGSCSQSGWQGKVRGASLKMRSPKRTLEWATLSWQSPRGLPMGQTSLQAEGPSGLVLISYQKPQKSLPAAWLQRKWLVGCVIQKEATEMSVCSIVHTWIELIARLYCRRLFVSIPSSMKQLCPFTLYPTLYSTLRQCTPCRVITRAIESWTALPRAKESVTSPFMWKWMQQRPMIRGCPHLVNSEQAICPTRPFSALPASIKCEPQFSASEVSSPITFTLRVSRPTSARISILSDPQLSTPAKCRLRKGESTVIVLPLMATMFLRSASQWSKLVEATTMVSPTCQSTGSWTMRSVSPALMVEAREVQVYWRTFPWRERKHSMQPMPLLPNIGCCGPQYPPDSTKVSWCWCGLLCVPARNCPPTTVMKPAEMTMSASSEKARVPFWTRMPSSLGVDWSTRRVMPAGTNTKSPSMGGMSVPQVRISLHRITYLNSCSMTALQLPTRTAKELRAGRESLEPTVQVTEEAEEAPTAQGMPSMVMEGVSKLRQLPLRVMSQPPKTLPLGQERVFTTGVWSSLNSIELARRRVFAPSSQVTCAVLEARSVRMVSVCRTPSSSSCARLHLEVASCANRTQRYLVGVVTGTMFQPEWTVESTVARVVQVVWSLEACRVAPSKQFEAIIHRLLGKKRTRVSCRVMPAPTSAPMKQAPLEEDVQIVPMNPSKAKEFPAAESLMIVN